MANVDQNVKIIDIKSDTSCNSDTDEENNATYMDAKRKESLTKLHLQMHVEDSKEVKKKPRPRSGSLGSKPKSADTSFEDEGEPVVKASNGVNGKMPRLVTVPLNDVPKKSCMEEEMIREKRRNALLKECAHILKQEEQKYTKESLKRVLQDMVSQICLLLLHVILIPILTICNYCYCILVENFRRHVSFTMFIYQRNSIL